MAPAWNDQAPSVLSADGAARQELERAAKAVGVAVVALSEARLALGVMRASRRQVARQQTMAALQRQLQDIQERLKTMVAS
jgi:hypothetical protein